MVMQVALAHYDVRNGGQGVEVFVSEEIAIEAVVGWVHEANLIGNASYQMSEIEVRQALESGEQLVFDTMECYYSVEMMEVQEKAQESGVSPSGAGEALAAVG